MLQKFAPFGPNNTIPVFMTEKVTNFIGTKRVGRNNEHLNWSLSTIPGPVTTGAASVSAWGISMIK